MTVEELKRDFGADPAPPPKPAGPAARRALGRALVLVGGLVFAAAEFISVASDLANVSFTSLAEFRGFTAAVQSLAGGGVIVAALGWYLFHAPD